MSDDTTRLAMALVRLAASEKNSPAEAAEKMNAVIVQIQKAAIEGVLKPLMELGRAEGWGASLKASPVGWVCEITAPGDDYSIVTHKDAEEAVQMACGIFEKRFYSPKAAA